MCSGSFIGITCDDSGRVIGIFKEQGPVEGSDALAVLSLSALLSLQLQCNSLSDYVLSFAWMASPTLPLAGR